MMTSDRRDGDFVSLIKFSGRPILPPVMTPSILNEMRAYRQTAIDLEYKRNERRRLRIIQEIRNVTEKVKALNTQSDDDQIGNLNDPQLGRIKNIIPDGNIFIKPHTSSLNSSVPSSENIKPTTNNTQYEQYHFENPNLELAPSRLPSFAASNQNFIPPTKPLDTVHFTRPSSTSFDTATDISAFSVASTDLAKYMTFSPESVAPSSNVAIVDEQLLDEHDELHQSRRESLSSVATQLLVTDQNGKEGIETPKSHLRRSSYTLEAPSPALLAAMLKMNPGSNDNLDLDPPSDHVPSGKKQHLENFLQNVSSVQVAWQETRKSEGLEEDETAGVAAALCKKQEKVFEDLRQELDVARKKGLQDSRETQHCPEDNKNVPCRNDAVMKRRCDKLSAAVKGYLVRRLMNTERVQVIIKTIQDTLHFAINFHSVNLISSGNLTPEDVTLHQRILSQLSGACYELHDIFNLPAADRMAIIAQDRELTKGKAKLVQPVERRLSSATVKAIERRSKSSASYVTKNSQSPGKRKITRNINRTRELRGVIRPSSAPVPQKAVGRYLTQDAQMFTGDKPARNVRRSLYGTNYA